ncbi:hypothetical protein BXZ70DRAFT_923136 [Cristinia sonorae]|uniref:Uncharacterized protein n=1 Tax=Cristinia sonorae TaxID=1940300 RepID=A0A8K0UUH7_9AGAR|nr:hypothetical protein BXZ70DRAFT_923136 [Cristinia sonorae]
MVLKFTSEEKVLAEAGAYDFLEFLQGSVIPKLYGVFCGETPDRKELLCLVMERFGTRLNHPFRTLKTAEKAKILDKLVAIHDCGLHHLDFAERNVLYDGSDYRITDFGFVEEHLSMCSWSYRFCDHVGQDHAETEDPTMKCGYIRRDAMGTLFWHDAKLYIGREFWVSRSDNLPAIYHQSIRRVSCNYDAEYRNRGPSTPRHQILRDYSRKIEQ